MLTFTKHDGGNDRKADIIITEVSPKYTKELICKHQFSLDVSELYTSREEGEVTRGVAVYITNHLAVRAYEIKTDAEFKKSIWVQLNITDSAKHYTEVCIPVNYKFTS